MENIKAVLDAAGSKMSKVVKTTVFLLDMNDFGAMNGVYGEYFTKTFSRLLVPYYKTKTILCKKVLVGC